MEKVLFSRLLSKRYSWNFQDSYDICASSSSIVFFIILSVCLVFMLKKTQTFFWKRFCDLKIISLIFAMKTEYLLCKSHCLFVHSIIFLCFATSLYCIWYLLCFLVDCCEALEKCCIDDKAKEACHEKVNSTNNKHSSSRSLLSKVAGHIFDSNEYTLNDSIFYFIRVHM